MVKEKNEIYKCPVCGNIVEVLHVGGGELVCCGRPMELQIANTIDASLEKHVPVIEKIEKGFLVKIGSVPHPMTEEHHIEWIEILIDGNVYRKFLEPGMEPQAEFCVSGEKVSAREYCNLHGLWQA
jgi:superoxide reductase